MDRVTESFLADFAKEHELSHLPQERQFEHFAAFVTVRRHYNGEAFATDDIHTGGGGDTGIDAIAVLVNGSLVTDVEALSEHADISGHFDVMFVFVQADRGSSFEGRKISDFGFGVKDFFDTSPRLMRNETIQNAAELMEALYKEGTKFRPGNPICRLYYATTGTWTGESDLEARRKAVEDDLRSMPIFRDVGFECLGAEQIQQLYRQTKNAVTREFTFTNRTLLPEIAGVSEAYIGFIPFSEFLSTISDDDGELLGSIFYENVRDWQDYTAPVNREIRETVQSDHVDRFVLMNNGITMIARNLHTLRRDRFQVEDFQIVNGCQTTHVLFNERDRVTNSLHVPLRIIATENEGVIKLIIRGTNRQTKVEDDQFFALTDFAEQLEDYFQTFDETHRLYYERRSGQYTRQPIVATRVVTHRNLVRAVASMFLEAPDRTQRRYQSLRENIGKDIFARGQKLDPYYVAAYAMYRLDVNFRTGRVHSKLKPARFHILLAMRYLANPDRLPPMNSHEMVRYCNKMRETLWDSAQSDELCARAATLAEAVAEGNFHRDNIRTQQFTTKVVATAKEASANG